MNRELSLPRYVTGGMYLGISWEEAREIVLDLPPLLFFFNKVCESGLFLVILQETIDP